NTAISREVRRSKWNRIIDPFDDNRLSCAQAPLSPRSSLHDEDAIFTESAIREKLRFAIHNAYNFHQCWTDREHIVNAIGHNAINHNKWVTIGVPGYLFRKDA